MVFCLMAMSSEAAITVYVTTSSGNAPYLWAWNDDGNVFSAWPGEQLTKSVYKDDGTKFWYYTFDESCEEISILFNNGSGKQTSDITSLTSDSYFTYDDNYSYSDVTSQYAHNENTAPPLPNIFKKVTSTDELTAGSQLLIVYESSDGTNYALGAQLSNTSNVQINRNAASVTITNGEIDLDKPQEEMPTILTLGKTTNGYTFYGDDGYYLAKSGTASQNRLSQSSTVTDLAQWTISITNGVARIQNVGAADFYIQKTKTSKLFAAYKDTQYDVVIYKKDMSKPGLPMFSVAGGTYYQPVTVTITSQNADEIRYTTNGVNPALTDDYEVYDEDAPLYIEESCTLMAVAVKGENVSEMVTATYVIVVKAPVISVASGTYHQPITVKLTADGADEIRFTTNGDNPAESDSYEVYDEDAPLYIDHSLTLKAVAVKGTKFSEVVTAEYNLVANAPVLSLPGGTYLGARSVIITCDEGSYVLYTVDGTDPTVSETAETYDEDAPIYFEHSGVLKAVAVTTSGLVSDVVTAEYTIKNARNRIYNFTYTSEEDLAYYGISENEQKIWTVDWAVSNYYDEAKHIESFLHTEGLEFSNISTDVNFKGKIFLYPNYAMVPVYVMMRLTDLQPNDEIAIYYGPVGGISDNTRVGGFKFIGATLDDESQKIIKGSPQWVSLTVDSGINEIWFTDGYLFGSDEYRDENGYSYSSYVYYIIVNPMAVSIGDDHFASYVTTGETDFKESGIKAYTITAIESGHVTLTEIETATKGTPVIVEKEQAGNWLLTPCDWGERVSGNLLKASDGTVVANGTHYALAKKESGVGFYKVKEGLTIPEGKVYLTANAGARDFLGFTEDTTTGITQMEQNNQPTTDNGIYSLSGVRVQNPTKGLYISNGKKMFVK